MTDPSTGADSGAGAPPAAAVRSGLSDGEWHRLHPLTPLLRGGLFLLVVLGIVVTNLRDRVIGLFLPEDVDVDLSGPEGDAIDYIFANNLILIALLGMLGILIIVIAVLYVMWRAHTFRITGDDVEVRSGVLFRTHRRAPLDRVQGVNLTRPMIARLLGMAKLEVVGAGLDANVKLDYLSTVNAEEVRADILRLASGRQLDAVRAADARGSRSAAAAAAVEAGLTGLILGAEGPVDEPESVVHIPTGRVIASHLLSDSTIWLLLLITGLVAGSIFGTPWVLFTIIPTLIAFATYWFRSITRALRYSVAPTPSGMRITFGLFTTITETLPPGRIHAIEVRQPLFWRPANWWSVRVNRLSGRAATDTSTQQFAEVLPVGTLADVDRVLRLMLPTLPADEWTTAVPTGILGGTKEPMDGDFYTTTPRRARWMRIFSWRRNGFLLTDDALYLRRGILRRTLVILPLARLQSVRIAQGPLARLARTAAVTGHTVLGQVSGHLGAVDAGDAYELWSHVAAGSVAAAADDHSHRWDAGDTAVSVTSSLDAGTTVEPRVDTPPADVALPASEERP
ncbi:PH domain-containing protein [Microbacterium memoriense]|uniref:PH domain-containing protein n=1 Tax=Microbacterium memoriense TaxID=2978350 RepID=A0ABT2PAV2_9MICO|nr:PH domain-containing protein [Microbacterium memoriense]MCT9001707.1 PH domain-containing protein [Microbacterium memoriense]